MEPASSRHAASLRASDSSISSPRHETLAGVGEEEAVETMHGRRLSTADEGSQEAHAGAGVLRPALGLRRALFPSDAAEKGKQKADADLPCDVAGALRRPAPGTGPDTEIEEAPPSPPPPSSRLLARNATRDLGAAVAAEEERGDA